MNACLTAIGYAVADFLIGSTLLLLPVLWLLARIQQPAYRLAAARATLVALAVFATTCFLPAWPRFSVRNAETAATVSLAQPIVARESSTEQPYAASVKASPLEDYAATEPASATIERQEDAVAEPSQTTRSATVAEPASAAVSSPSWRLDLSGFAILAVVELMSAAAAGLWLVYGAAQTIALCHRAVEAPAFLRDLLSEVAGPQRRQPRLLLSPSVPNPVALGVLRPTIVLPIKSAEEDGRESLQSALAHEWAHIRHNDLRFLAVSRFLLVLLAIHPLYLLLCRRIREDQEALADAAASVGDRREYAAELLRWARRAMEQPAVGAATLLGIWESKSQLSRRVATLLDDQFRVETDCPRRWRWPWLAAMAVLAACLSLATLRPLPASDGAATPDTVAGVQPKPAEKASGEAFTGTSEVIDTDTGKPIEGATVRVVVRRFSDSPPVMGEVRYRTDAHGRCTFTIPAVRATDPPLGVGIQVSHPGYCTKTSGEFLTDLRRHEAFGEPQRFERVHLVRSEPASGTLVTPDGKPAAGVTIRYMDWRPASGLPDVAQKRWLNMGKAVTDQQGRFRLDLARRGRAALLFMAEDHAPQTHAIPQEHGELGRFELEKGGTVVKGRVLDESGNPVSKVWITAINESLVVEERGIGPRQAFTNTLQRQLLVNYPRSTIADAQGSFTLAPLAPGRYRLTVGDRQANGETSRPVQSPLQFTFLSQELIVEDNQASSTVEIRAVPQVVVEGQYAGGRDGIKRDAWCSLGGMLANGQHFSTSVRADRTGGFVLRAPKGLQQARLDFQADQYSRVLVRAHRDLPDSVEQEQGSRVSHTLVALGTLGKDIRGIEAQWSRMPLVLLTARAEDGSSIRYLIIDVKDEADAGELENPKTAGFLKCRGGPKGTGIVVEDKDDGRYCISGLLPDRDFTVSVRAHGCEPKLEKLKLPEGAIKKLEVTLKKNPSSAVEPP